MKNLTNIAVVVILIIFPAVSYYYLKSGFDYRKIQLKEIQIKGPFIDFVEGGNTTKSQLAESFEDRVTIIQRTDSNKPIDTMVIYKLKNQFKNNAFFNYQEFAKGDLTMTATYADHDLFLINKEGNLLNSYQYSTESMKSLIAHTAVSLPFEKRMKIKLKRQLKTEGNE